MVVLSRPGAGPAAREAAITTYAIAHMREVTVGPAIVEYLERIDATLEPFEGRFLVHGTTPQVLEGEWPGTVIVIGFPSRQLAQGWFDSPAYREILPLRLAHSASDAILVDGAGPEHRAVDVLA